MEDNNITNSNGASGASGAILGNFFESENCPENGNFSGDVSCVNLWRIYEIKKREIIARNYPPSRYEKEIKRLADELNI